MGQRYAFLDYEGLQRYDQDWLDEIERMKIKDWEIENLFNQLFPPEEDVFEFTIKIDTSSSSTSKSGIPFNLYRSNEGTRLIVDWGDGNISQLTASNYSDDYDYTASVHSYSSSGFYDVTVKCNNWKDVAILDRRYEYDIRNRDLRDNFNYFSKNVYSLSVPLPKTRTKIISADNWFNQYNSNLTYITSDFFKNYPDISDFTACFRRCTSLTSIPADLFKYNVNATNFEECFRECTSLTSIPADLFKYNVNATNFATCFHECSALDNFTLHIGSPIVISVSNFIQNKSNTTRTIYVPNNSATKTKFDSVASSFGITVIGE